NGKTLAAVAKMGSAETRQAIAAGKAAMKTLPPMAQRREWLEDIYTALMAEAEEVGRILCLEHGKPWQEAQGEVAYAANFFKYCADHLDVLEPRTLVEQPKN